MDSTLSTRVEGVAPLEDLSMCASIQLLLFSHRLQLMELAVIIL